MPESLIVATSFILTAQVLCAYCHQQLPCEVSQCHVEAVSVSQGAAFCELTSTAGQPTTVAAKAAAATATTAPSCLIRVSFEAAFAKSGLTQTATVNVVLLNLVLRPQNYDFIRAEGALFDVANNPQLYTALQPIACSTSDYEQVTVSTCTACCSALHCGACCTSA